MKKIGFIIDGSSTLTDEELKKNNVKRIYFKIVEDDRISYNDKIEEISYEKIDSLHKQNKSLKTSCSSIGEVMDSIDEELKKNDFVFIFTISKSISSQYSSIKMLENDYKDKIYVVDTNAQCYGLEYILLESIKMYKEGKSIEEIISFAESENQYIYTSFVSESSKPATSSGRLSKALIGKVLDKAKITPIINMNEKISLNSFATSYRKALIKMVYKTKEILEENGNSKKFISIYSSLCDEKWKKILIDEIEKIFNIDKKEILIKKTPLIIFANTGKNSFGLAVGLKNKYKKE